MRLATPLQLAPRVTGEAELVLDVDGAVGVVRQLVGGMLEQPQVLRIDTQFDIPLQPGVDPILMPFLGGRGLDEELHFHLLELAGAENEVARGDLVAKALADLADTERRLLACGRHHVGEVDENALRGLRAQIVQAFLGLDGSEVGLEHHVELARLGPPAGFAGVRVADVGQPVGRRVAVFSFVGLDEVVGAVALVGDQRLDQRVVEDLDMAGRHPHLAGQDDRRIQADDVLAAGDHRAPPLPLDVLLELHAQRAVVPGRAGATVDLPEG